MKHLLSALATLVLLFLIFGVGWPLLIIYEKRVVNRVDWWIAVVTKTLRRLGFQAGTVPVVACLSCGRSNRLVYGESNARCGRCHEPLQKEARN